MSDEEVEEIENDEVNDEDETYKELHKDDDKYAEPNPTYEEASRW